MTEGESKLEAIVNKSGVGLAKMNTECAAFIRDIRAGQLPPHELSKCVRLFYLKAYLAGRKRGLRDLF